MGYAARWEKAMTNLSSINHISFARLHEITQNYNKATLLDKLIFWWQISEYSLDDGKIWFTRSIEQIVEESKISQRSVERYLHEFESAGYIKKQNKLLLKKRLYIQITEKLLVLLGVSANQFLSRAGGSCETVQEITTLDESNILEQVGVIDSANLAVSIYKDKDNNLISNNTVSDNLAVNNSKYPQYAIEKQIGERLNLREKNYIKGIMLNLQTFHGVNLSAPEQIFAEIVFSVLNTEQMAGISNFNHRMQIIAKLLRENRWSTPKGFYNHSDYGSVFKNQVPKSDKRAPDNTSKNLNIDNTYSLKKDIKKLNAQLSFLRSEVAAEVGYLKVTQAQCKALNNKHLLNTTVKKIELLRNKEDVLKQDLDTLCMKLTKLSTNQFQNQTNTKLDRYNLLCEQQKTLEEAIKATRHDMDYALTTAPDDSVFLDIKRYEYQKQLREIQEVEDELHTLGNELYSNKVA